MTNVAPLQPTQYQADLTAVSRLREAFDSGKTRPLAWRRAQLEGLRRMLVKEEKTLLDALHTDLHKHPAEGWSTEIASVKDEIKYALKHLKRWSARRKVATSKLAQPGRSWLQPEPLGVVLNIAAWNYPVQQTLSPMVGMLAAGNCVVLKPSELAPASARALEQLLPRYVDTDCVAVYQGGPEETGALLKQRFDHILYTGNGHVGRIVATAAAQHLTPVTLELGGKSPAIVDSTADITLTARRLAWGKWQNAGQICITPDYVLIHDNVAEQLITAIKSELVAMYGADPQASPDYGRIINQRHFDRLDGYLEAGTIVHGGQRDRDDRFIAPTLVTDVDDKAALMTEEIFGPILVVKTWSKRSEVIRFVSGRDKPLAMYLFTKDRAFQDQMLAGISAGNVCINDVLMFMVVPTLPFGGVGGSGYGSYSGQYGFDTFSHLKPVLKRSWMLDVAARYAPFTPGKERLMRLLRM